MGLGGHYLYHWSDAGVCSWYDCAVAIGEEALAMGLLDKMATVRPIATEDYPKVLRDLAGLFMISSVKGADTSIHLASSPEVVHVNGKYFVKRKLRQPSRRAMDDDLGERLWSASQQLLVDAA